MQSSSITVIIPTYNRAAVLGRALTSVLSQTKSADEVLVVDDGSTDGTDQVLANFPQVQCLKMPQNSGAAAARNAGVQQARNEWIGFLDSDDLWLPNRLEEQWAFINENPDTDLLISGITVQEKNGSTAYYDFPFVSPESGWNFSTFQTYPFSTPTWLIRKSALLDVGGFDSSLQNCEDLDLLAKLVSVAKIRSLRKPLVVKFNQSDSIDADLERVEASYRTLFKRHSALWQKDSNAAVKSLRRLARMRALAGQPGEARAALRAAIGWQPVNWKLWAHWLLSWVGK